MRLPGRAGERLLLSVVDFESREELIVAAPQLERDGGALIQLGEELVDLRSGLRFSRLSALNDRQDDVARLNVAAHPATDVLNDHAVLEVELLALFVGQVDEHESHPIRLRLFLRNEIAPRSGVVRSTSAQ